MILIMIIITQMCVYIHIYIYIYPSLPGFHSYLASGGTKCATSGNTPLLRPQSSGGKFTTSLEIEPVCRSFCRHGSRTFTEVARLVPSGPTYPKSLHCFMPHAYSVCTPSKYVRTYVRTYVRAYVRTYVCMYIYIYIYIYVYIYIHTYTCIYIYIYIVYI